MNVIMHIIVIVILLSGSFAFGCRVGYDKARKEKLAVNGIEAHILLLGLDKLLDTDKKGKIRKIYPGYSMQQLQELRDLLFATHEHPDEQDDG